MTLDETTARTPFFKKIDRTIFEQIDKFKQTPNYTQVNDFYNSLEEDQQKVAKALALFVLFTIPLLFLSLMWWQNGNLRSELEMRVQIVNKAQQIIGQSQGLKEVGPQVLSMSPIDAESMMSSRLSNIASGVALDLSKLQIKNFSTNMISTNVMKSEADFAFNNLSTDELMNLFTGMIQQEKFRIQSVEITRNNESNLLQGQFHALHFSMVTTAEPE